MSDVKEIDKFFLLALLRISIAGTLLILVTDLSYYPQDALSLRIDFAILAACTLSFLLRNRYFNFAVMIITCITLLAMFYQCLAVPINTTTSFSIILIVGFVSSILLKGKLMWIMHSMAYITIVTIFIIQTINPALRFSPLTSEVITVAITYLVLYSIISYCTGILKWKYDQIHVDLQTANRELYNKANEIEAQNEELLQVQDNLNELNRDLEKTIYDRTARIQEQNRMLIKYSYTNAHHLRGPVARLLGLIAIYRLGSLPDVDDFFNKVEGQAQEIDTVVKQINAELEISEEVCE